MLDWLNDLLAFLPDPLRALVIIAVQIVPLVIVMILCVAFLT